MSVTLCRALKQHLSDVDVGQKMKQSHDGKGSEIEPKHHHKCRSCFCALPRRKALFCYRHSGEDVEADLRSEEKGLREPLQ